ncbi:MAG TPA: hypothetical protein VNI60_06600 [Pyrinomonadaceae bacterium]|nr:hypothetical protein [Pyrinomonadaceae bacterium]
MTNSSFNGQKPFLRGFVSNDAARVVFLVDRDGQQIAFQSNIGYGYDQFYRL